MTNSTIPQGMNNLEKPKHQTHVTHVLCAQTENKHITNDTTNYQITITTMTMTTSATQFTKESECAAEGVGSILKFFASTSNLSPARVVGKTLMKFYGLAGDGSDDQFLERVWRSMGKCSFNFAHARARQCRYRLGHGSKTLRRMLKASAARKVKKGRLNFVIARQHR